tara:strand:+ start:8893 stop:9513 length:621 start_codon:yes stop_codon:yes gene_type:complete
MDKKVSKVDYSKGLIYKLCCKDTLIEDIYIGSTTNFKIRKSSHKSICNRVNAKHHNCKVYQVIRENGGFENWDMILIQYYSCNTKKELEAKEREYIEKFKSTLNSSIPNRKKGESSKAYYTNNIEKIKKYYENTKDKVSEKQKIYRENNKSKLKQQLKEYYEKNKPEIREKQKIKIECEYCKSVLRKADLNRHRKTKKCLKFQLNK